MLHEEEQTKRDQREQDGSPKECLETMEVPKTDTAPAKTITVF